MFGRRSLLAKGLILVSVPLIFELLFIGFLSVVLIDDDHELRRAAKAQSLLAAGDKILREVRTIRALAISAMEDPGQHALRATQADPLIQSVRTGINELSDASSQNAGVINRSRKSIETIIAGIPGQPGSSEFDRSQFRANSAAALSQLGGALERLIQHQHQVSQDSLARHFTRRRQIVMILTVGVAGNILLAVALATYFARSTITRLRVLMDNTKRLASSKPLNEAIPGQDEIAELDFFFRDMANKLTEARHNERELERVKQEFVQMIGHDLRTPLTSIQGSVDLLATEAFGTLSEDGKKILAISSSSIRRLIALINELLDIEKMESGKFDLHMKTTSSRDVIEASLSAVSGYAKQQMVQIVVRDTDDVPLCGDLDRLTQVIVNLLGNAIKVSKRGQGIELFAELLPGSVVEFRVTDQGPGIPEAYRSSIFDRFKQVEAGTPTAGSSGLGLAICKTIVELHNGTIGVDNVAGGGSSFWFTIPQTASVGESAVAVNND